MWHEELLTVNAHNKLAELDMEMAIVDVQFTQMADEAAKLLEGVKGTKLVVEDRRDSPHARKNLRRYQWAHFRKWADGYIEPGKVFALRESRRVPAKLTGKTAIVKIFLVSRNRDNPAPIELKRAGGVWRIYSNSL